MVPSLIQSWLISFFPPFSCLFIYVELDLSTELHGQLHLLLIHWFRDLIICHPQIPDSEGFMIDFLYFIRNSIAYRVSARVIFGIHCLINVLLWLESWDSLPSTFSGACGEFFIIHFSFIKFSEFFFFW